ncbi:hypothetical protein BC938DRAFT_472411 [Jimgerdemannia flammicorona]|uniref:Uncharacterized protein n=1 Tax=Jimgerdemannia flammicorona TaxID=994334 RepID=A0A433Q653_9FUNG|nr:hypothetical protein BC938DRAFT_472411 [Jimgerdemannia flammicorona]
MRCGIRFWMRRRHGTGLSTLKFGSMSFFILFLLQVFLLGLWIENLRKSFATAANDFQRQLNTISTELASLQGDLDYQLSRVNSLTSKLQPLKSSLGKIEDLDRQCTTAHVEENDYTIYTVDDLSFDLKLVQQAVQKKFGFIENQVWRVIVAAAAAGCIEQHRFMSRAAIFTAFLSLDRLP